MSIILAIIIGGLFGFALYYVGLSKPWNIMAMLRFKDLTLMKTIFFAIGFASFLLFLANLIGIFDTSHYAIIATNLGVIVGAIILGLGFGLAGACPGTMLAASTTGGKWRSILTILGGLLGALTFNLAYGWLASTGLFSTMAFGQLTLFHLKDGIPSVFNIGYWGLAITGVLFMLAGLVIPSRTAKKADPKVVDEDSN